MKRCEWCGRRLRWWQLKHCRTCRRMLSDAGIYLQAGGPPCSAGSRRDAPPDRWLW
jgi:hypothetical protein